MAHPASAMDDWSPDEADNEGDGQAISSPNPTPSKRQRVREFASKAKAKVKDLPEIVVSKADGEVGIPEEDDNISNDPAFNRALTLEGGPPQRRKESTDGVAETLKKASNALIHPRRTARVKATQITAEQISKSQRPYLSAEQDLELLRADDDLARAASSASSTYFGGVSTAENSDAEAARKRFENIEDNRASLKTAWALGRHVVRVRAVQKLAERPGKEDFLRTDIPGQAPRFEWERWVANLTLYYTRGFTAHYIDNFDQPPFDVRDLARNVERLAMVSAPWQAFLIDVRKVYMWHDTKRTWRWMSLFWILWYTEHIVGFVYAYIIYTTIRNKFYPTSVASIRDTMSRNLDRQAKAQAWGELIEKHGRGNWIEPLLDDLGPVIQMQLGDMANFIEVLANFYRWERPEKTAATLFYYTVCLLITLLTDMRYCMKLVWLIIGGTFFLYWPLATRFPKYRIIVNVLRWVFWDIPTHAELGIIQLQSKAILDTARKQDDSILNPDKSIEGLEVSDEDYETAHSELSEDSFDNDEILNLRAVRGKERGRLVLTRTGIQFQETHKVLRMSYQNLVEMRKTEVTSKSDKLFAFQAASEGLEFQSHGVAMESMETLSLIVRRKQRDKIFNYVLAYSGLKWQSLQPERHTKTKRNKKLLDQSLQQVVG